jgi:hypothetical protein
MSKATIRMQFRVAPENRIISVPGRDAWALRCLIAAGERGCTPIDNPGPRWSAYVHKLKRIHDLNIQTIQESHGGDFPGSHARYKLVTKVELVEGKADA